MSRSRRDHPAARPPPWARLILPMLVVLIGAAPIAIARPAPLQDWPNHVARIHILLALLRHDGFWSQHYRFTGFLTPDAVMDLSIAGLSRLGLPVRVAAQCFLLTGYGLFVAGFCALARALDAWSSIKPVLAVLLFYGNALFWGLVSYVLGLGLMLGLLALWLGAAKQPAWRLCLAALAAVLLLFTHLVVAGIWVIVLGCFDLHRVATQPGRWSRRVTGSASWLAALVTMGLSLSLLPASGGHDASFGYAGGGLGAAGRKLWLFGKLLLGGGAMQDAASLAALLACLVAVLSSRPRLAAAPSLAVAALALTALLAPERIGDGSQLDSRLALPPLLLLAAGVAVRPRRLVLPLAGGAVCARTLLLVGIWHASSQLFAQYRSQAADLPPHSLMMMAYGTPLASLSWRQIWSPPITSIATQVVFRDLFMPAIFANPSQQPIGLRGRYVPLKQPWNMSDAAHRAASEAALAALCGTREFRRIFLTVLYPGTLARRLHGGLLVQRDDFLILDACRLR